MRPCINETWTSGVSRILWFGFSYHPHFCSSSIKLFYINYFSFNDLGSKTFNMKPILVIEIYMNL